MKFKNINIDGVEYKIVRRPSSDVRIVILTRGWVMVGNYERDGDDRRLYNSSVIRTWGTTMGLGELAINGPTADTTLDPNNGTVEFTKLSEIATIACDEGVWKKYLK